MEVLRDILATCWEAQAAERRTTRTGRGPAEDEKGKRPEALLMKRDAEEISDDLEEDEDQGRGLLKLGQGALPSIVNGVRESPGHCR